jgi:hypothetical protein
MEGGFTGLRQRHRDVKKRCFSTNMAMTRDLLRGNKMEKLKRHLALCCDKLARILLCQRKTESKKSKEAKKKEREKKKWNSIRAPKNNKSIATTIISKTDIESVPEKSL